MINKLQQAINSANNIVFFTGAGLSTASGIPDFRSATGLYKNVYRAEEMLSHTFFEHKTDEFFEFYKEKMLYPDAKPNYAHEFMAKLQDKKNVSVVTQNIDGLHQKAGSKIVYELHGTIHQNFCTRCGRLFGLDYVMNSKGVPHCDKCGGIVKPNVVLYEESLDEDIISRSINAIMTCDVMIVIGTSLKVYPAAGFIRYFKGRYLVVINKESTSYDNMCDLVFNEDVINVVKNLK